MQIKKFTALLTVLVFILITAWQSTAGWLDDWYDQQTSSAPGYFEGQKRGYFTAGSFSARVPSTTDYLVSINKPRIKGGCGGIDAFLGGFGFTNFDYLVDKFQRLIQAAPIVAFQIALNTLSSALNTNLNQVEKIINDLNNIQLNECSLLKPFTTIDLSKNQAGAAFEQAATSALKSTGLTTLYHDLEKFSNSDRKVSSASSDVNKEDTVKGCPSEIQNLLKQNSFLDYVSTVDSQVADLIPYIRAISGDIVIAGANTDASGYQFNVVDGCAEMKSELFKNNRLSRQDSINSPCVFDITDLNEKVYSTLLAGFNAIKNRTSPQGQDRTDYENLLKLSPLSLHLFLRYAMMSGDESVLPSISGPVARGVFYQALLTVQSRALKTASFIDKLATPRGTGTSKDNPCGVFDNATLKAAAEQYAYRLNNAILRAREVYAAALNEIQGIANISQLYSQFESTAYSEVTTKFGTSVGKRLFSR